MALKETLEQESPTQDELRSRISITLMTSRSSHIYLHQLIDDHHKRGKPHTNTQAKQKG